MLAFLIIVLCAGVGVLLFKLRFSPRRPDSVSYKKLRSELEKRVFQPYESEDRKYLRQLILDLQISEKALERELDTQSRTPLVRL